MHANNSMNVIEYVVKYSDKISKMWKNKTVNPAPDVRSQIP